MQHHSVLAIEWHSTMEFFSNLLSALGVWNRGMDIIGNLPVEVAVMILQKLDPVSLINAAKVSSKWMSICRGSARLRKSASQYLRRRKRRILQEDVVKINRTEPSAASTDVRLRSDTFQSVFQQHLSRKTLKGVPGLIKKHYGFCNNCWQRTTCLSKKTNSARVQMRIW